MGLTRVNSRGILAMNINPIKAIHKFNKDAGFIDSGYNASKEAAYPIEEALEGLDRLGNLSMQLTGSTDDMGSPKDLSRIIVDLATSDNCTIADVDALDKHVDSIVFNFGSIFKLGLTPQQAMRAISIVMEANMTKLTVGTDSQGKQMKPKDFVPPEAKLQKLLDER